MPSKFGNITSSIDKNIITHIKEASFFMKNPHISQCIDGRRTINESNLGLSVPGGAIGQLAIIISVLEETVIGGKKGFKEAALEILIEVIGGKENLSYHTDNLCTEGEIGCGHITLLLKKEARKMYGLSDSSTEFIKEIINQHESTAIVNVLKGEHKEIGILKVYSTHHSIHANYSNKQFFVYTPKIAYIKHKEIARKIHNKFVKGTSLSITVHSLTDMLQQKMDISFYHTIHTLAPELPVYRVSHSLNGNIKYLEQIAKKSTEIDAHK